jgi:hypothetical protein
MVTQIYYDGKVTFTAFQTDKGYELWSYTPAYDWDGNTLHATLASITDCRKMAFDLSRRFAVSH